MTDQNRPCAICGEQVGEDHHGFEYGDQWFGHECLDVLHEYSVRIRQADALEIKPVTCSECSAAVNPPGEEWSAERFNTMLCAEHLAELRNQDTNPLRAKVVARGNEEDNLNRLYMELDEVEAKLNELGPPPEEVDRDKLQRLVDGRGLPGEAR